MRPRLSEQVTLNCSTVSSSDNRMVAPLPSFQSRDNGKDNELNTEIIWLRNGRQMSVDSDHLSPNSNSRTVQKKSIIIRSFRFEDNGLYQCCLRSSGHYVKTGQAVQHQHQHQHYNPGHQPVDVQDLAQAHYLLKTAGNSKYLQLLTWLGATD